MALAFKLNKDTMDIIMEVVRTHDVTPSRAVDLLLNNEVIYKETKYVIEERGKVQ